MNDTPASQLINSLIETCNISSRLDIELVIMSVLEIDN